ncbi:hypothetical protein [Geminocystis sp. GBBB08]|uniref:hypothetical protein n=1 Tax=Geminocystis sp. GBBB08 TaxID=2604140 RepID=UPI0027E2F201|nr:hypothetical protein [Geminocystis sp. GBBB08]
MLWHNYPKSALAETVISNNKCGNNLEDLANLLVKDLPDYANRVIQRNRIHSHPLQFFPIYVITAGKTELESLPLSQTQYKNVMKSLSTDDVKQVFFTTLERQYSINNRIIETQNFHWLILTKTPKNWKIVMVLTKLGYPDDSSEQNFISSPPLDTTEGIIGQAVKLWLRDCY